MNRPLARLLAPLLLAGALLAQDKEAGVHYKLEFAPEATPPKWLVEVEVTGLDVTKKEVAFTLNDWGEWTELGSQYLLRHTSNPPLQASQESPAIFNFNLPEDWDGSLQFSYELALLEGSSDLQKSHSLLPHISEDYSFGYSNNTLARLQIKGEPCALPTTIDLFAPLEWEVVTGWGGKSSAPQRNLIRPEESALIAFGKNIISSHKSVNDAKFECHALSGTSELTAAVVKLQSEFFPALGEAWGEALGKTSLVIFVKHQLGGTRMDHGIVVGLGPDRPERYLSSPYTTQLFAHEFFHEWLGGKLLREDASLVWFGEGVTDYLSVYYTTKLDLIPKPWFIERITEIAEEAMANSSLGQIAFGDPEVNWRDGNGPNETMAYKGGALLAFAMDVELREKGHEGLMGLMKTLLARCEGVYFLNDIKDELENLGLAPFYDRYIAGKEVPDLSSLLEKVGAKQLVATDDAPTRFGYDEVSMAKFFE